MFITYNKKGNYLYARVDRSIRKGKTVVKESFNLGRVIDKEKGIYKNRERGIFTYDLDTGTFGPAPEGLTDKPAEAKEKLILDFGDSFLLKSFIDNNPVLKESIESINTSYMDSFWTLLFYYILCDSANCHCETWAQGNYARVLFPEANVTSQRISDLLEILGDEYTYREFFKSYLRFFKEDLDDADGANVLIDSTGLPNSVHFPLTAISNHNGDIENEVRLIYVTQQETGLPIYFRYCAGNVIDVSTLERTIRELKANGINTKFSILDAGYMTMENLKILYESHISFLTRVKPNLKIYKEVIHEHLKDLETKENFVLYNERGIYIKRIEKEIIEGHKSYIYLGLDMAQKSMEGQAIIKKADARKMNADEVYEAIKNKGVFMLISSRKIAKEKLMPLYYTRDQIEKVFNIGKGQANLLPIRTHSEEKFRGHLLITFIASVVLKLLQKETSRTGISTKAMFMEMRNQKCKVYENEVITTEPVKRMNDIYKILKIKCPAGIPISG